MGTHKLLGQMGGRVLILLALLAALTGVVFLAPSSNLAQPGGVLPRIADEKPIIIVFSCPFPPFYPMGGQREPTLEKLVTTFEKLGEHVHPLFASYQDAQGYLKNEQVAGIWLCAENPIDESGLHASMPLPGRGCVVVTLADSGVEIQQLEDLAGFTVGIHPDTLRVLGSQLPSALMASGNLREISNHVLLSTQLFSGTIDALIADEPIFENSRQRVPRDAEPGQSVRTYRLFKPVHPKIFFKDPALRDRFNAAWKETAGGTPDPTKVGDGG